MLRYSVPHQRRQHYRLTDEGYPSINREASETGSTDIWTARTGATFAPLLFCFSIVVFAVYRLKKGPNNGNGRLNRPMRVAIVLLARYAAGIVAND